MVKLAEAVRVTGITPKRGIVLLAQRCHATLCIVWRFPSLGDGVDQLFDAASGTFGIQLALENETGEIPAAGVRCQVDLKLD